MIRSILLTSLLVLLSVSARSPALHAQTTTATLRGRVSDEGGLPLRGATLTARAIETNITRTVSTGEQGTYLIPHLPPGTYELAAVLARFAPARRTELTLRVGQELTIDFVLGIGPVHETVTVSTETPLLETGKNTLDTIIKDTDIDELPTVDRNFDDLALLSPGVSVDNYQGGSELTVNGQRGFANAFFIDGGSNEWAYYGAQASSLPQDWILEFQVMTNHAPAEFGGASGGVLNVITRSGTNRFRGSVYGFFRDGKLDSPPYAGFFDEGEPQFLEESPPLDQQRIGTTLGGPILRDRIFFFAGVENLNRDSSEVLGISEFWRAQGVEPVIPAGTNDRPFMVKVDVHLDERNHLSARFDRTDRTMRNYSLFGSSLDTLEDRLTAGGPVSNLVANLSSVLGGESFHQLRFVLRSNRPPLRCNKSGTGGSEHLQIAPPGTFAHIRYPGAWFGCPIFTGLEGEKNLHLIDSVTFNRGNHELKLGGEATRVRTILDIVNFHDGLWLFPSDAVFDIGDPDTYPFLWNGNLGEIDLAISTWNFSVFVQDNWRLRENVTLNLGLRYDLDRTVGVGNQFVDEKNARFVAKFGGEPLLQKTKIDMNNVAPRAGVTWSPREDGRTLIRASGGVFYDQNHTNFNAIYMVNTLLSDGFVTFNAFSPLTNPFWDPSDPEGSQAELRAFLAGSFPFFPDLSLAPLAKEAIDRLDPDFQVPRTVQFTVGLAQELGESLVVEADYVQSRGEDLPLVLDDNLTLENGEVRQIDERLAQVNTFSNLGWSRYHALRARADYRLERGRLGVAYTLARTTSNTEACIFGCESATNPFDLSEDEGPDDNDRRHNFVAHGSYRFPGDVRFAAICSYRSALPYSVFTRFQLDDDPFEDRPEPRNSRRGDDFFSLDFRLSKELFVGDRVSVLLFWEMFNAFDTNNFTEFIGDLQSADFGTPISATEKRRQQFGFRLEFF